jgi:hypothetical protein
VHLAIIEERKLTQYLLASSHPAGGAKAAFFQRFGFSAAQWQTLRDALHEHSQSARIVAVGETRFGGKYTLEGQLTAPDGLDWRNNLGRDRPGRGGPSCTSEGNRARTDGGMKLRMGPTDDPPRYPARIRNPFVNAWILGSRSTVARGKLATQGPD